MCNKTSDCNLPGEVCDFCPEKKNIENNGILYDGFLKVKQVEYNGKKYDTVDFKDAVSAFVESEDGSILLVKQYRPAIGYYTLEIPAGVMDCPELTEEEVMKKELLEEAGIIGDDIISVKLVVSYLMAVGVSKNVMYVFYVRVKDSAKDRAFKDDDVSEKIWSSPKQIAELWKNGMLCDAKTNIAISNVIICKDFGSL